jgi:hypothetical protein
MEFHFRAMTFRNPIWRYAAESALVYTNRDEGEKVVQIDPIAAEEAKFFTFLPSLPKHSMKMTWLTVKSVMWLLLLLTVGLPTTLGAGAPICKKDVPRITLANLSPPFRDYDYFRHREAFPFACEAATFRTVNAWWLAEIATLVYADAAFSRPRLHQAGLTHLAYFDRAGTHCVVAANDRFAVVAFRGSQIWKHNDRFDPQQVFADFKTNIDIRLSDWEGGGRVHRGFKSALDAVWEEMMPEIRRLQNKGLAIWITGHSLGAALATLAADRLQDVQGVYTFGSPRVGDKGFKARFAPPAYRVVNGDDIVTSVPPRGPFYHVGELVTIDPRGRLYHRSELLGKSGNAPCSADANASQSGRGGLSIDAADLIPDAIRDHVPLLYSVLLWNALVDSRAFGAEK